MSRIISEDSQLASDEELTKSTLFAVWNVIGSAHENRKITNYEQMDSETFHALGQTFDYLIPSSNALGL